MPINDNTQRDAQTQSAKQRPDYQEGRPEYQKKTPQEEARAYSWKELTPEQQEAGSQVLGLIQGMLEAGDQRQDDMRRNPFGPILPIIRDDHNNNVILIDGGRGSGKTSLMATILQSLEEDLEREQSSFAWSDPVIPVAFLDLHPLPESTHLLLHLVGRLERVTNFLESLTSSSSRSGLETAPWKSADRVELNCRQRWRELFEAVVTWESNLPQRAANLDLDFYAWELGREETRRRGIGESFRTFIDALCLDMSQSSDLIFQRREAARRLKENQPFFIIAVDDADLVPERSVEVLDLLRKLWHPRLLFLLTGYSRQFSRLLRNYYLGVLTRPLSNTLIMREREDLEDDAGEASKLASSIYEKIIPPGHRCVIPELSHEEKLGRLKDQLQKIILKADLALGENIEVPEDLYYYFENEKYATAALPSRIRSFLSVASELATLLDRLKVFQARHANLEITQESHKQIALFIHKRWNALLESEPLIGEDQDVLRSVIRLDERGMLFVEGFSLVCQYTPRRIREVRLDDLDPARRGLLAIGRDYRLSVFRSRSRFPLPEPIKGALKLATDLAADIEEFYFLPDSPTPSGFKLAPVEVRWEEIEGFRPFPGFSWPLPDWHDFLSFTLFHQSWSSLSLEDLPQRAPSESHLEILARRFLNILLTVAEERRLSRGDENSQPPSFEELSKRVAALSGFHEQKRPKANSSWANGRAGLLAAPESGLPSQIANTWLSSLRNAFADDNRVWARVRKELQYERRQQIRERWDGPEPDNEIVEEILKRIDDTARGFEWTTEIDPPKVPASRKRRSSGAG